MPKRRCRTFHAIFTVALILCLNVSTPHLGGGALASRAAVEIKAGGSLGLFDESSADNGSRTGHDTASIGMRGGSSHSSTWRLHPTSGSTPRGSASSDNPWPHWYNFNWFNEKEIDNITVLLAVDGGGTQTKVLYEPCEDHCILDVCCATWDREFLLEKLNSFGFSIPCGGRIPMTGGLAVRLQNPGNPLRQFVQHQDEVKSLAHGILPFMEADEMRSFTSLQRAFFRREALDFRENRFIYVDLSDQKPFITEVTSLKGFGLSAKTLSRKGIDGTTFKNYFKHVIGNRLKDSGIETSQVLEKALERVKQRIVLEDTNGGHTPQDAYIEEDIDKLRELHSGFHVKVEDIYPDGYAGLHPLISAAFMAKLVIPDSNGTVEDIIDFAVNFAMGYLEMVAQNAVSLAKSYQQMVGAGHVIFGGQLVSSDNLKGEICKLFIEKYIKRLFQTKPNKAKRPGPDQNTKVSIVMPSPDNTADNGVSVWLHEEPLRGSAFESIKQAARSQGKGRAGLGERPTEFYKIHTSSCCARHPRKSFVLASVGTGSPIAKVTVSDANEIVDLQKIGGSAIGGGTSAGLLKASMPELGSLPLSFEDEVQRPLTVQAYNVIAMISKSIAEIVSLAAVLNNCSTVVFTGGFLQNNIDAEAFITNVCLEFGLEVLFQKPHRRSFTAVVGAYRLSGQPDASTCLPMKHAHQESKGVGFMISMLILVVMAFSLEL